MNTQIMAILNITPDSFSDGGRFVDDKNSVNYTKILDTVEQLIQDGADIIDVGGESTKPGAIKVSRQEEIERIIPVIERIKDNFDIRISVDTYKAEVARLSVEAGADIINDIGGLKLDAAMASTVAKLNVPYILMHNKVKEDISDDNWIVSGKCDTSKVLECDSYVNQVAEELNTSISTAINAGIKKENIIIDPGIGFNKTYEQNLWLMKRLDLLCKLGCDVLLGTSRKSFIGTALELNVDERVEGTLATTAMAVLAGCKYVRVHDVKENYRIIKMLEAIYNS